MITGTRGIAPRLPFARGPLFVCQSGHLQDDKDPLLPQGDHLIVGGGLDLHDDPGHQSRLPGKRGELHPLRVAVPCATQDRDSRVDSGHRWDTVDNAHPPSPSRNPHLQDLEGGQCLRRINGLHRLPIGKCDHPHHSHGPVRPAVCPGLNPLEKCPRTPHEWLKGQEPRLGPLWQTGKGSALLQEDFGRLQEGLDPLQDSLGPLQDSPDPLHINFARLPGHLAPLRASHVHHLLAQELSGMYYPHLDQGRPHVALRHITMAIHHSATCHFM